MNEQTRRQEYSADNNWGFPEGVKVLELELPARYAVLGTPSEDSRMLIDESTLQKMMAFFTEPHTEQAGIAWIEANFDPKKKIPYYRLCDFLALPEARGSGGQVTFTTEAWANTATYEARQRANHRIRTWVHTHPNLGSTGQSPLDDWIMKFWFKNKTQPAVIIDPFGKMINVSHWQGEAPKTWNGVMLGGESGIKMAQDNFRFNTAVEYLGAHELRGTTHIERPVVKVIVRQPENRPTPTPALSSEPIITIKRPQPRERIKLTGVPRETTVTQQDVADLPNRIRILRTIPNYEVFIQEKFPAPLAQILLYIIKTTSGRLE